MLHELPWECTWSTIIMDLEFPGEKNDWSRLTKVFGQLMSKKVSF